MSEQNIRWQDTGPGRGMELVIGTSPETQTRHDLSGGLYELSTDPLTCDLLLPPEAAGVVGLRWTNRGGWEISLDTGSGLLDGLAVVTGWWQVFRLGSYLEIGACSISMRPKKRSTGRRNGRQVSKQKDALEIRVGSETFQVNPGQRIILGSGNVDIQVPRSAAQHAAIHFVDDEWVVEDLASRADLLLDGSPVGFGRAVGDPSTLKVAGTSIELTRCLDERFAKLLGSSEAMAALRASLGLICERATILLHAEAGLETEEIAREIHAGSRYSEGAFAQMDCMGSSSGNTFDSDISGHEKGAFTGANTSYGGLLREAEGGTLFLTNIHMLSIERQTKFLRVLQERRVRSVGGDTEAPFDVQIIVAVPPAPEVKACISARTFREDLYQRLSRDVVEIPALRHREGDVLAWTDSALRCVSREVTLSNGAAQAIQKYSWPGNIAELNQTIGVAVLSGTHELQAEDLKLEAVLTSRAAKVEAVRQALIVAEGNKSRAAKILGCSSRTLGRRMAALGVTVDWAAVQRMKNERMAVAIADTRGNIDKAAALLGMSTETFVVDGTELLLKYRQEKKSREIEALTDAWGEEGGNVAAMARRLSLPRQTVESRLKKYELFKYRK